MKIIAYFIFFLIAGIQASIAGIAINSTRIIYNEGTREYALRVANVNEYPVLFQPWVDHGNGDPNNNLGPFVIVPPFMKMEKSDVSTLRMIQDGSQLPADRESVFWLNLYEVPLVKKKKEDTQYLNMAMNTQVKVFYRPKNLKKMDIDDIVKQTTISLRNDSNGNYIFINNPTGYSLSILSIRLLDVNDKLLAETIPSIDTVVMPFSSKNEFLDKKYSIFKGLYKAEIRIVDDFGKILSFYKDIGNKW